MCYVPINCFTAKWTELSFKLGETSFTLPTILSGNFIKQDWQCSYLLLGWAVSLHSPTHMLSNEQVSSDHWRAKKPGKAEFLTSLGGKKLSPEDSTSSILWEEFYFLLPHSPAASQCQEGLPGLYLRLPAAWSAGRRWAGPADPVDDTGACCWGQCWDS